MHQSIATIASPEFINLQPVDINPLMSSCEIKVLYIGENRNHSYITKEVATEMAKTLRGAPIVGWVRESGDFGDHGEQVVFDGEGVKFNCLTKPYGFVSPDAKIWFQKFEDYDEFGNAVEHEYMMTTGYLWTGQFEECKCALDGKGQSMELDEDTLDGHWAENTKNGVEFFIINDAIFSKLCILGDDVEPCFEGANVTAPKLSSTFSKMDDDFTTTLFSMIEDLKNVCKGGQPKMNENENKVVDEQPIVEFTEAKAEETTSVEFNNEESNIEENITEEFAKKEEDSEETSDNVDSEDDEEKKKSSEEEYGKCRDDDEKKKCGYELEELQNSFNELNNKYTELQSKFSEMEIEYNNLVSFKKSVDDAKKDELINSFYMLSDEDKKEVIENKDKYSYDDIEAKLSIICVRKKVNFDLEDNSKNDNKVEEPIMTFNLEDSESSVPAWIKAVQNIRDSRKGY